MSIEFCQDESFEGGSSENELSYLVMKMKNARINMLNRPLKELLQFQEEIMDKIAKSMINFIGYIAVENTSEVGLNHC